MAQQARPGAEIVWFPGSRLYAQAALPPLCRPDHGLCAWRQAANFTAAALSAFILLPVLLPLALALRASGSPVLVRQRVVGRRGMEFDRLRFADPRIACTARQGGCRHFVGMLGGFLDASRLGAAPQLLNVMRGSMAMLGPRPVTWQALERTRSACRAVEAYLLLQPGIVGPDFMSLDQCGASVRTPRGASQGAAAYLAAFLPVSVRSQSGGHRVASWARLRDAPARSSARSDATH
jgi:hypothetical protein